RGREGLSAVLEAIPEESLTRPQAAKRVDDVRIGRGIDVVRRETDVVSAGHVAEHPPADGDHQQPGTQGRQQATTETVRHRSATDPRRTSSTLRRYYAYPFEVNAGDVSGRAGTRRHAALAGARGMRHRAAVTTARSAEPAA